MQCVYWNRTLGSDLTAPLRNPVCSGCGTWVASRVTSVSVCPSFPCLLLYSECLGFPACSMNVSRAQVLGCEVRVAACFMHADTEQVPSCDVRAVAFCMNAATEQGPGCDVTKFA